MPKHFFSDVGCGSLRGGVHFIRYLEAGHYYGIDKSQKLLDAGRNVELRNAGLIERVPTLLQTDTFEFGALHRQFDFAIAQSVFTHIALNDIVRCMMNMEKALNPGGRFYVTFFENPKGKQHLGPLTHPRTEGPGVVSFFDKDPFHYDFGTFQWICQGTRLRVEYIGEWNHPRGQRMESCDGRRVSWPRLVAHRRHSIAGLGARSADVGAMRQLLVAVDAATRFLARAAELGARAAGDDVDTAIRAA